MSPSMNENLVHVLIFVISTIFSAGAAWAIFKRQGRDINGIGRKVNQEQATAARRYHNISLAILISAPEAKESEISELLKEGS